MHNQDDWMTALRPVRFLFFTGKGGVGKTSLSCATALALADRGLKTLLVSTDPASNLDQVLNVALRDQPTPIPDTPALWALNINPREAAAAYRERVVGPYRGVLPESAIASMEEQLSGACTVEIAAFDAFSRLMTDPAAINTFTHIVFDTAPTGHTLRLLQLPAAWKGFLDTSKAEASCLGPLSGLGSHKEQFAATVQALADPEQTRLVLVARPERHALIEAERTSDELTKLGVTNQLVAINGVLDSAGVTDEIAASIIAEQQAAVADMPDSLAQRERVTVALTAQPPIGLPGLRGLIQTTPAPLDEAALPNPSPSGEDMPGLNDLMVALGNTPGVIMTMGKGGVGKTTMAMVIAVQLAQQGVAVHLTTSDPAAHVDAHLAERVPGLRVSRIDPAVEVEQYRQEVMATAGAQLDAEERSLLEEDLRSPCTEEIAVFRAFAKVVDEAQDHVVVIDTAPTGHTILLLDATAAYHREVLRTTSTVPDAVRLLLPRLRDPAFTRILVTTLPEATPVQEGIDLVADVRRAGIEPFAWIANRCLTPLQTNHPTLRARQAAEREHLDRIHSIASRSVVVPWIAGDPIDTLTLEEIPS